MKILLVLISLLLLSGCAAWGNISDQLFGVDTKKTINFCNDNGKCTKVTVDGDQSDAAQILMLAAQLYGVEITIEDE
jgi:hypothetical protein